MRCFENHHVVAFEELKKSGEAIPIHKPILCVVHPNENMKFYCYTCQVRFVLKRSSIDGTCGGKCIPEYHN